MQANVMFYTARQTTLCFDYCIFLNLSPTSVTRFSMFSGWVWRLNAWIIWWKRSKDNFILGPYENYHTIWPFTLNDAATCENSGSDDAMRRQAGFCWISIFMAQLWKYYFWISTAGLWMRIFHYSKILTEFITSGHGIPPYLKRPFLFKGPLLAQGHKITISLNFFCLQISNLGSATAVRILILSKEHFTFDSLVSFFISTCEMVSFTFQFHVKLFMTNM